MPGPLDLSAGAVKALGALRGELQRAQRAVVGAVEAANGLRRTGERSIELMERLDRRAEQLLDLGTKVEANVEAMLAQTERLVAIGERMADTGEGVVTAGNRMVSASGDILSTGERLIERSVPVAQALERARHELERALPEAIGAGRSEVPRGKKAGKAKKKSQSRTATKGQRGKRRA